MPSHRRQSKRKSQPEEEISKKPKHQKANDVRSDVYISAESVVNGHHCDISMSETAEKILADLDETQPPPGNTVSDTFRFAKDEEYRPTQPPSIELSDDVRPLHKNLDHNDDDDIKDERKHVNLTSSSNNVSADDGIIVSLASSEDKSYCSKHSFGEDHKVVAFTKEVDREFNIGKDSVCHDGSLDNGHHQFPDNSEEEEFVNSISILETGTDQHHSLKEPNLESSDVNERSNPTKTHIKCQMSLKQINQQQYVNEIGLKTFTHQEKNVTKDLTSNEVELLQESKTSENTDSVIRTKENDENIATLSLSNIVITSPRDKLSTSEKSDNENGQFNELTTTSENIMKQENGKWEDQKDTLEDCFNPRRFSTNEIDITFSERNYYFSPERNEDSRMDGSKKSACEDMKNLKEAKNSNGAICNIIGIGEQKDEERPAPDKQPIKSISCSRIMDLSNSKTGESDEFSTGKDGADTTCVTITDKDIASNNLNGNVSISGTQTFVHYRPNGRKESPQSEFSLLSLSKCSTDRCIQLKPFSYNKRHHLSTSSELMLHSLIEAKAEMLCTSSKLSHSLPAFTLTEEKILNDQTTEAEDESMTSSQGFDVSHIEKGSESERFQKETNNMLDEPSSKDGIIPQSSETHTGTASHEDTGKSLSKDNDVDILNVNTQPYFSRNSESITDDEKNNGACKALYGDKDTQFILHEGKKTIHFDQTDSEATGNGEIPEKEPSEIELSISGYDLLMNDISDSQLCEASRQTEMEQKWDQARLAAVGEVEKQKQLGRTSVDFILRELRGINRQVVKFKREMEILKSKISSSAAAASGQTSLPPKASPSSK